MVFSKVNLVYFSATDVSKKYAHSMGYALAETVTEYDITMLCDRAASKAPSFTKDELVILSLPIYGGRVPAFCIEYLNAIKADGTACIIVGTYGNRHYDDALVEMEDIAKACGFTVIACAAVVGRHSFSSEIAGDRPNADDLSAAAKFAKMAVEKELAPIAEGVIPGNRPYKDRMPPNPLAPSATDECTGCLECVRKCPNDVLEAVDGKPVATKPMNCLKCHRCVLVCPKGAIKFTQEPYFAMVDRCIAGFAKPDRENLFIL